MLFGTSSRDNNLDKAYTRKGGAYYENIGQKTRYGYTDVSINAVSVLAWTVVGTDNE